MIEYILFSIFGFISAVVIFLIIVLIFKNDEEYFSNLAQHISAGHEIEYEQLDEGETNLNTIHKAHCITCSEYYYQYHEFDDDRVCIKCCFEQK